MSLFKNILDIILYFFYLLIFFLIIEFITRLIIFIPTNSAIFKYGFSKTVIFDVVDLSKLQITVVDKRKEVNSFERKIDDQKVWIFGGSTTYGSGCEGPYSSSWPKELEKINNNFNFKNYAIGGANTDDQINLLYQNIDKHVPEVIMWANKFNTKKITGASDYRNKHILKYEFTNAKKTNFFVKIKTIDKTLKSNFVFYNLADKIFTRIMRIFIHNQIIKINKIEPSMKDWEFALKNFKINTLEAIELSKKYKVKEFYIVSLLSKYDFDDSIYGGVNLYYNVINEIEKIHYPYVKIISTPKNIVKFKIDELFCDPVHQTLKMNKIQAKVINDQLKEFSKIIN